MKRYKTYKDCGVKWIGQVPKHWELKKAKHFLQLITKKSSNPHKIGLENIESFTGKHVKTDTTFDGDGVEVEVEDIVYGKLRPYLCKVWLATFACNAVGDFYVFRCNKNVNKEYVHQLFLSPQFTNICNASTYGAKMPRVAAQYILSLPLPVPPLHEQQAIVDYLKDRILKIEQYVSARERERAA